MVSHTKEPSVPIGDDNRTLEELGPHYKWIALSNTTLGMLVATINSSIVLIALPDIFNGIHLNPLEPGNTSYLLWMMMGFLVVTAVLVVSFGRLGDMFGRARMYNMGFAVFTIASIFLAATWFDGSEAALWRLPRRSAWAGARNQRCRRDRRILPRPAHRRHPRADPLESDLPRLGSLRRGRHDLGVPETPRHRRPPAR